jgi:tripartite-type tricarboxylate transporter receptor subunit TctC
MGKRRLFIVWLGSVFFMQALLGLGTDSAWSQDKKYPSRSIEIICPWGAGGATDLLTRGLAKGLEKHLGVPVVTVNKPGGAEALGTTALVNSKPDGYTLGVLTDAGIFINILRGTATYSKEDLRIIGQISIAPTLLVVKADSPWKTINEFIDYARKNPGLLASDAGPGSNIALRVQYFNKIAGTKLREVAYKSDLECLTAALGDQVQIAGVGYGSTMPFVAAGKARILFSFTPPGKGPFPDGPNIPSVFGKDVQDFEPHGHYLVAPGKAAEKTIQVLEQALEKVTKEAEFIEVAKKFGMTMNYTNSKTAPKDIERKISQVRPILEAGGLIKK